MRLSSHRKLRTNAVLSFSRCKVVCAQKQTKPFVSGLCCIQVSLTKKKDVIQNNTDNTAQGRDKYVKYMHTVCIPRSFSQRLGSNTTVA